ncbi:hypothetical protein WICPIJ_000049 [Wickerhamomyces pijperi]|uniref:Uncharacterized protein n=1 Tax=Wickerhamomyces pijperi TaxID=599730 RepID=A0A9P8QHY4_WICPI|nr:hypothetical protein WICPIJ_000049 [Wickerhamomyces pijperi]
MKDPATGATIGIQKTVMEKIVMALPLCLFPKRSANVAGTTTNGAAPMAPEKALQIKMVCKFSAVATPKLKIVNPKMEKTKTGLRPYNSDNGAHTTGPKAKPNTYNDTPRMATVLPT